MVPYGDMVPEDGAIWGQMVAHHNVTSTIYTIRVQMGPCDAIWADIVPTWGHIEHTGLYWAIWAYVPLCYQTAPSNSMWGNMKPYGAMLCHMRPCGLILINTCVYIWYRHMHLQIHMHLHIHIQIQMHANMHPYICTRIHKCIQTYIHTYTRLQYRDVLGHMTPCGAI